MNKPKLSFATLSLSILLSAILFTSCENNKATGEVDESRTPVVTVRDETLYLSDLEEVVGKIISTEDTVANDNYVKMWIDNKLMYDKAKQNIIDKQDIDQMVEDYRKSLIVHSYQERLLKDKLAKELSDKELEAYYEGNKSLFPLRGNIIQGLYLKIPVESAQLNNFRKWYTQETDEAIGNIEKNTLQNAVGYEYFYNKWVSLDDVMTTIPYQMTGAEQFLRSNKHVEVRDSSFIYLLNIKSYKLVGDQAPYDYIKPYLTEVFLEKKRTDYLKQIQQDLYDKAVAGKEIKFHNK